MKNKILVTGGTGYIGSHTCIELINSGYEVIVVDNLSNSELDTLDRIEEITGTRPDFFLFDLKDRQDTVAFLKEHADIDAIIHFAAYKSVVESVKLPLKYYRNNINALINILECMNKNTISNIVFSSSCTVYGQPDELPVTENSPIKQADSPYGNTKQISEDIIRNYANSDEHVKAVSLRYFNPIGAHESGKIGELPLGVPDNLVPYITQTAAGVREQLKVFGNDYNTPDGTPLRDYIHIGDLAKAHVAAVERLLNKQNKSDFEAFNIGTGKGNSVLEVIKTFEEHTGEKINYTITDRRPGDIEKVWADTSLADKELGWKAEKTLGEALASAWKWEKNLRKPG